MRRDVLIRFEGSLPEPSVTEIWVTGYTPGGDQVSCVQLPLWKLAQADQAVVCRCGELLVHLTQLPLF